MTTIKQNDTLTIRFVTDSDLRPTCKVIERKGSFAVVQLSAKETVKRKVYNHNNCEFIFPYGKYSMAPIASN